MSNWELTIGDAGHGYEGTNRDVACALFNVFYNLSRGAHGEYAGKSVTLLRDGEAVIKHEAANGAPKGTEP